MGFRLVRVCVCVCVLLCYELVFREFMLRSFLSSLFLVS